MNTAATLSKESGIQLNERRAARADILLLLLLTLPFVVEACTNLASASWTSLQTCTLTNGSIYLATPGGRTIPVVSTASARPEPYPCD
jgi:hypothetical protein